MAALILVLVGPVRSRAASTSRSIFSLAGAVLNSARVRANNHGNYTNIIFLHHSVGYELIRQGRIRERLTKSGFEFYDHHYNGPGLTRPDGKPAGYSYNIPNDNTDPDGLLRIFEQRPYRLPLNALSGLLQHEVIVLKSCFLAIRTLSADDLERQKKEYLAIRMRMKQHPDKLFIIVTSPPANPAETDAGSAFRARRLATWLASDEFHQGVANVCVFDLFNLLAENNPDSPDRNMLRSQYRTGADSHPNPVANETAGSVFTEFVIEAAKNYAERKRQYNEKKP
jgi:hypothetical protein